MSRLATGMLERNGLRGGKEGGREKRSEVKKGHLHKVIFHITIHRRPTDRPRPLLLRGSLRPRRDRRYGRGVKTVNGSPA